MRSLWSGSPTPLCPGLDTADALLAQTDATCPALRSGQGWAPKRLILTRRRVVSSTEPTRIVDEIACAATGWLDVARVAGPR